MLIADIKGKLTLKELLSEDFLTSSVFSVFRYLDECWIERFLNQAINIYGKRLNVALENPSYEFWPWYSNEATFGHGAEPDVVIFSGQTAIIIEAKNYSGKKGDEIVLVNEEQVLEQRDQIIDQLAREYFVGLKKIVHSQPGSFLIKDFYLVYLTRHSFLPKKDIEDTLRSITSISTEDYQFASNHIFWLNWQKIIPILNEIASVYYEDTCEHKICEELIKFLERRDLCVFSGFSFLDYDQELSRKFRQSRNANLIFYRRVSSPYWRFLYKSHLKETNLMFYRKAAAPYWRYVDNVKLSIENKGKEIFYTQTKRPLMDFFED